MPLPFTNVHTHIFNSPCAPPRFLLILPNSLIRRIARPTKWLIDTAVGRWIIRGLFNRQAGKESIQRKELDKYVSFLEVGTNKTQKDVFLKTFEAGRTYDSSIRIVGLTMNMDYMDNQSKPPKSIDTQLEEVKEIKRHYPANFFPFLGVDPRHKSNEDMLRWARPYFESGVQQGSTGKIFPYFCGIKIYPALGFFPFDPRLHELYLYAEQNQIPVMTHCTRVGSQYIGEEIERLLPRHVSMLLPSATQQSQQAIATALAAKQSIEARIATFYDKGWIKNSKRGENDRACDLFGHPENYITLLETYPKLKICFAHMGGSDEILDVDDNKSGSELKEIRAIDQPSWFERIKTMMIRYPNMYTDISYTLTEFNKTNTELFTRVKDFFETPDHQGNLLVERVLFGTDFFMTEREKRESELYADTKKNMEKWWDTLGRTNPQTFLQQPV